MRLFFTFCVLVVATAAAWAAPGDGTCDDEFNTPEHGFDGGDCCAWTNNGTFSVTCGNGGQCSCISGAAPTESTAGSTGRACKPPCGNGGHCLNGACICFNEWSGQSCAIRSRRATVQSLDVLNSGPILPGSRALVATTAKFTGSSSDLKVVCRACAPSENPLSSLCSGPLLSRAESPPDGSVYALFFGTFYNTTAIQCRASGARTSVTSSTLVVVTSDRKLGLPSLPVRREIRSLSKAQWNAYAAACNELKRRGIWQYFVDLHVEAANRRLPDAGEKNCLTPGSRVRCSNSDRNSAHRGPTFLPWHRQFLIHMEGALRMVSGNPLMTIPYWDWRVRSPSLFSPAYFGSANSRRHVTNGPFEKWGLKRCVGCDMPFVSSDEVNDVLSYAGPYDRPPYDAGGSGAFRDRLEGFEPYGMHNQVHMYVNGDMIGPRAPEDPIFFPLHAFVDYIWYRWTARYGRPYQPADGDPHAPVDSTPSAKMFPWQTTISEMFATTGYAYDLTR